MKESRISHDLEDFWYYLETKRDDTKGTNALVMGCMVLYCCEQMIPGKPELQEMLKCFDFCFEENKVKVDDVYKGIVSSLHIMDMMDTPKRYEVAKTIIRHLIEKNFISEEVLKKKLSEVPSGLSLE